MRRFLILTTAVLALAACGDDDTTGSGSIFGTYTLETIDGTSLPIVLLEVQDFKLEITAGSVRLNGDNTYSASITFRTTEAGNVTTETDTEAGTFTATGSTLQFDGGGVDPFTGSISGNVLTISDEGITLVFRK